MMRSDYLALVLIAVGFALGAYFYADLPDPMPTHFRADGTPDNFTRLPWGAVLLPLVSIGLWGLLKILPAISPREFSMDRFRGAYQTVMVSIIGFMTVVQFILLRTAVDPGFDPSPWIRVVVGAILLVVANYVTKTEPNFFFGVRTPWTLANEEVWFRTHRQAAYWLAACGVLMLVSAWLTIPLALVLGFVVLAAIWLVVYSYIAYVRVNKTTDGHSP
jgi:uncharacterized membrane protein